MDLTLEEAGAGGRPERWAAGGRALQAGVEHAPARG